MAGIGIGRLRTWWITLKSSLWFVPTLLVISAIGLAIGLIQLDVVWGRSFAETWPRMAAASPEGARSLLTAVAGSMITVAGVIFSVTIVTLSLASNQYTPRILRNFMRDRGNQVVLGVFVGIFTYCLIVLRVVRTSPDGFVPEVAVVGALLLAIASIGFLIYFIHHTAVAVQASEILIVIAAETIQALKAIYPSERKASPSMESEPSDEDPDATPREWHPIPSPRGGYIQQAQMDQLIRLAAKYDVVIRMDCGIGEYIAEGATLASVAGARASDRKLQQQMTKIYGINSYRTIEQDPAFGIRQIVDIALKALSLGINDSTTARHCIEYLETVLSVLLQREIPSPNRYHEGQLRLIARQPGFPSLINEALDEIRRNARDNVTILLRLLDLTQQLLDQQPSRTCRSILLRHVDLIGEAAELRLDLPSDRQVVQNRVREIANGAVNPGQQPRKPSRS